MKESKDEICLSVIPHLSPKEMSSSVDPEWGLQIVGTLSSFLETNSPETDTKPWIHMQIFY